MIHDPFQNTVDSPMSPAERCFTISPSDIDELTHATKAIYVGTGGDIALIPLGTDNSILFRNVVGGSVLDIRVKAVRATGTTAADLIGLA